MTPVREARSSREPGRRDAVWTAGGVAALPKTALRYSLDVRDDSLMLDQAPRECGDATIVYDVCRAEGYEPPLICTPNELLEDSDDEDV